MPVSQRKINEMYERVFACLDAEFADLPAGSGGETAAGGLRAAYDVISQKAARRRVSAIRRRREPDSARRRA
jgi:hypothetical protein